MRLAVQQSERKGSQAAADATFAVDTRFVDKRPAAASQMQSAEAAACSPQAITQRALADRIADGPRMAAQRAQMAAMSSVPNHTGLPAQLKRGVEQLSGHAMDHVRVHYNSDKPVQMRALAYAHGSDIHIAPRQEKHLPHEAWHAAQQTQGRVQPTLQAKGIPLNNDPALEHEADVMGARAAAYDNSAADARSPLLVGAGTAAAQRVAQLEPDPTVATINPKTTRPVVLNLWDKVNVIYIYNGTDKFFYKPLTAEYTDVDDARTPLAAAAGFNEDAAPAVAPAGGQNTFRGLTFTVDASNRVTRAAGSIHQSGSAPETGRSGNAQTGAWEHVQSLQRSMFYTAKSFNGGHIIAHHLGGSPGTDNMVPMEKDYNQSGSYKTFENALDAQFDPVNRSLDIQIDVAYATDYADLMTQLVTADNGNTQAAIDGNANTKAMVMRTLGRIPKTITLTHLRTLLGAAKAVAAPTSPMLPLRAALRANYDIQNILKTTFTQVRTGKEDKKKTTREPFSKSFGPNKNHNIDINKDYHADYQALYANMPRPGITEYIAGANGLAGGVKAYIWIDPMGVYDRFGGSETNDVVDPQGSAWAYFRKAVNTTGGGKIYKKGHLLNAHLHGPGADSRNLLPITTAANNDMSHNFEQLVKGLPALVDPAKGVLWETRTSGGVTRPLGWNRIAAAAQQSVLLFDEEAKLPQYIDCFAWEAIRHHGSIEKGRLLLYHRVQNKHPNDTDGGLGITRAGDVANDTAVHASVPIGNNNVTGHAVTAPVAGNTARYERGYNKDYQWLALNRATAGVEKHFLDGLADVAYNEGFALAAANAKIGWSASEIATYNEHYQKGWDRFSYKRGYLGQQDSGVHGNARADNQYNSGLYQRGRDEGERLVAAPHWLVDGPALVGYRDGLYFRGKKDADAGHVKTSLDPYYGQGYMKSLRVRAYGQGYACEPANALGMHDTEYAKDYAEGQYHRGQRHGYGLKANFHGQTADYNRGYGAGLQDRGYDDGMDVLARRTDNPIYTNARNRGLSQRGRLDGERLFRRQSGEAPYVRGWRRGVRLRGIDDGYARRRPADRSRLYNAAWSHGARRVTYDEGYEGVWNTTHDLQRYDQLNIEYDNGRYDRGRDDGYRRRHAWSTHPTYQRGYREGRTDRARGRRLMPRLHRP